jgi:hypothetical protein
MPTAIAPMAMPKAADDMTGSVGFGVGLAANVELVGTTPDVALRYWLHDNLVLEPSFAFGVTKSSGVDTGWNFAPQLVVMFVPFRSTSTRLLIGGGLGFSVGKTPPVTDTAFAINIPVRAGVEHFFTRWLSAGIAAGENFFSYQKQGTPYQMAFNLNTATLVGQLFFYTD